MALKRVFFKRNPKTSPRQVWSNLDETTHVDIQVSERVSRSRNVKCTVSFTNVYLAHFQATLPASEHKRQATLLKKIIINERQEKMPS